VKRYYGWIPPGPEPKRDIPAEPEQTAARNVTVDYRVPLPAVMTGWQLPPYASDDHYALAMLSNILSGGRSARLDRALVYGEDPQAVGVGAMHMQLQDAGIFAVNATVMQGKDAKAVESRMSEIVRDVIQNGVTPEELEKARTQYRVEVIRGRQTADSLAGQLGEELLFGGDANRVNTFLDKLAAITPEQVQAVAKKYLTPQRATTMTINPDPLGKAAQAAKAEETANAPVKPSDEPVKAREVTFPSDWPKRPVVAKVQASPSFEKGTESTTANGVRVIVMPDRRLPLVSWSVTTRRGSHADPKGKEGLASLTGDMLRRGAGGATFAELNNELESRGITLEVSDGGDYSRVSGSSTSENLEHGLRRTRDVLLSPAFPADEFEKLKQQSIESLVLSLDSPSTVAGNDLDAALFGDSPLGRSPTPASVKSITLDDVKAFYKSAFRPQDAVLVISGDVSVEQGQKLAQELTQGWEAGELPPVAYDLPKPPAKRKILLVDRPSGKQSVVRIGIPAYTNKSDEKFPGSVAGQILTSGIDSRLGRYVRRGEGPGLRRARRVPAGPARRRVRRRHRHRRRVHRRRRRGDLQGAERHAVRPRDGRGARRGAVARRRRHGHGHADDRPAGRLPRRGDPERLPDRLLRPVPPAHRRRHDRPGARGHAEVREGRRGRHRRRRPRRGREGTAPAPRRGRGDPHARPARRQRRRAEGRAAALEEGGLTNQAAGGTSRRPLSLPRISRPL
jgi:zinc protease